MTRQQRALGNPPTPSRLVGFPRWSLATDRVLYRAHSKINGPWWFATAHGTDSDGRFDLPAPDGTCYLASTEAGAARERWGRNLVRRGYVVGADADTMHVSRLTVPQRHRLADTVSSRAANYGVTREIGSMTPYAVTQAWAVAFRDIRCTGARYQPRFSTGRRDLAYALFGAAGSRTWPTDPLPIPGRTAAANAGINVVDPPRRVRIIAPPPP